MKYLSTAMYTGVFTIAYSAFLYQHYSAAYAHPEPFVATAVVQNQTTNSRSASSHSPSAVIQTHASLQSVDDSQSDQLVASNQIDTEFTSTDNNRKAEITASKRFVDSDVYEQGFNNHHPADSHTTIASTTSGSGRLRNITNTASPSSSYIASNKVATSIAGSASATGSTSESSSTEATNSNTQTNITGSEYLPDGKSQEDLYNSKLGQPHTYSISDYQKANINCEPTSGNTANGSSGGFNDLLHQLKGC
jgi:hypothetical protein